MKKYRNSLAPAMLFVTVLSLALVFGASDVRAQGGGGMTKKIQGSWVLVKIVNEQHGKNIDLYGPNPKGYAVYAPDGHWSFIIMRADLPKFASNNRTTGTAEENQAVVRGCHAAFGTYKVISEKDHMVSVHIEGSSFPNWDGQDQKRVMTVTGDEMKVTNPFASSGGTNYLIWKRVK